MTAMLCLAVGNLHHNFIHLSGSSPKYNATIGKAIHVDSMPVELNLFVFALKWLAVCEWCL